MRRALGLTLSVTLAAATAASPAYAASLRGSPAAMVEQNTVAKDHGLTFYASAKAIAGAVARGELVELKGNENYEVADFVRFPYLQPEARLFVERLSAQYREACGQKLVVTSAVRPTDGQPSNSHRLSVHPAGMAVDLRVSDRAACRDHLESAILSLEAAGVLNGIREFHPPHYHVAVYPGPYLAYVEERLAAEAEQAAREAEAAARAKRAALEAEVAAPAAASFVPVATDDGRESAPATPLLAALAAALLALPLGVGAAFRRRRTNTE